MIYFSVSATAVTGKEEEGVQWMKKLAQYNHEHFVGEVQICRRMDGSAGRYVWLEKHTSLASYEEDDKKFQADSKVKAILKEGEGFFTDVEFHFWQIL